MKPKNVVENTTIAVAEDPAYGLLYTLPGMIEASEKRGQQQLVLSEVLPSECAPEYKAALEKFGVVFGELVKDDPLFTYVQLPPGWVKKGTDHDMWSDLLDERGRKRASIFYKAAFYDRKAHIHVNGRYSFEADFPEDHKDQRVRAHVKDGEQILFTTEWGLRTMSETYDEVKKWLDENRPGWRSLTAHWDAP